MKAGAIAHPHDYLAYLMPAQPGSLRIGVKQRNGAERLAQATLVAEPTGSTVISRDLEVAVNRDCDSRCLAVVNDRRDLKVQSKFFCGQGEECKALHLGQPV